LLPALVFHSIILASHASAKAKKETPGFKNTASFFAQLFYAVEGCDATPQHRSYQSWPQNTKKLHCKELIY
jgi:hypothetical protein